MEKHLESRAACARKTEKISKSASIRRVELERNFLIAFDSAVDAASEHDTTIRRTHYYCINT